jgi:outer membrane lipoprotein-sorting protein
MRIVILFGLLLPHAAWAQAPSRGVEILRRVGAAYKAVSRYEFTVDATENGGRDTYHMEFSFKAPNKYRMQGSIPALSIPDPNFKEATIVYDGSDVWFYFPKTNAYGSFPSSALNGGGDLGDLKPEVMDRFMTARFRGAAGYTKGVQFLREESIEVAKAKVPCLVVMVLTGASESPYTWWIDKVRYRVLREDHEGTTSIFTSIRLEEPIRDELFKFEPPEGAKKLGTQ